MSDPTARDSYTQIVKKLTERYNNSCTSSLLLFKDRWDNWGVRIYAPYIIKEFSDDHKIGADPTGLLFYYDTFDMEDEKRYKVFLNNTSDPREKAIVVQFYDETPDKFFAQFVARFRRDERPPNFTGKGNWNHFDCALVSAFVRKTTTERKIYIRMESVRKQIIINIPTSIPDDKARFALKQWDHVLYNRKSVIRDGTKSYVDYNDDRIVLYQNLTENQDANAVILPTEGSKYGGIAFKSLYRSALYAEWKDFNPRNLSAEESKEFQLEAFGYVDDDETVKPSNEEFQLSED